MSSTIHSFHVFVTNPNFIKSEMKKINRSINWGLTSVSLSIDSFGDKVSETETMLHAGSIVSIHWKESQIIASIGI